MNLKSAVGFATCNASDKAEKRTRLAPVSDDNVAARIIRCKNTAVFMFVDYTIHTMDDSGFEPLTLRTSSECSTS